MFYYPLDFQAKEVLSLPASVRLSVCLSVNFQLESPNLHQICIMGYSWLVLKIGVIDFDHKGHFGHFDLEF